MNYSHKGVFRLFLRKRINKIETIGETDNTNVNIKEQMIKDMERRIYEIEVYKKRVDKLEERKRKRLDKEKKKRKKIS